VLTVLIQFLPEQQQSLQQVVDMDQELELLDVQETQEVLVVEQNKTIMVDHQVV